MSNQEIASSLSFRKSLLALDALLRRNPAKFFRWAKPTEVFGQAKAWDELYTLLYDGSQPIHPDIRFAACMAALLIGGDEGQFNIEGLYFGDFRSDPKLYKTWADAWTLGLDLARENIDIEWLSEETHGIRLFWETYGRWEVDGPIWITFQDPRAHCVWLEKMRSRRVFGVSSGT
jgi:hypothetical protein